MATLYLTKQQNGSEEKTKLHALLSEASSHATDERKRGITTEVFKAVTVDMPLRELLAGAFNRDAQIFQPLEKVKTVAGMKHPKLAKDG